MKRTLFVFAAAMLAWAGWVLLSGDRRVVRRVASARRPLPPGVAALPLDE